MNAAEADKLIDTIRGFVDGGRKAQSAADNAVAKATGKGKQAVVVGNEHGDTGVEYREPPLAGIPGAGLSTDEFDWLYRRIKERFVEDARVDPVLIHLASSRPELVVQFEPRVVKLNATDGVRGRVAKLIADGFFAESKAAHAVRQELKRLGNDPGGGGTLYDTLKNFARDGFLVVEGDRYSVAPGLKVTKEDLVAV